MTPIAQLKILLTGHPGSGKTTAIRTVVEGYPGLSRDIGAFSNERARAVLSDRTKSDLVVRLYGEDPKTLQKQAERVRQVVAGVDGIEEATVERPADEPTIEVEVDLAAAQEAGIKPGDVRRAAATLHAGLVEIVGVESARCR